MISHLRGTLAYRGVPHILLAAAALPLALRLASAQSPQSDAASTLRASAADTLWGKPVNGLQAGIRLVSASATVRIGDRINVAVLLRNTTDHPIEIAYGNAQGCYGWRTMRQRDGVWIIAPRWRYWREEKLEPIPAGARALQLAPNRDMPVPMKQPEIILAAEGAHDGPALAIECRPGDRIRLRSLPITAAARGEEWLDRLETAVLTVGVVQGNR